MLRICGFLPRSGEDVRPPENGVTDHCKPPTVDAGN